MSLLSSLRRTATGFSLLLLSAALLPASAQANPWYRVEVMLVAYQDEETIDHELWPDAISSEPPAYEITDAFTDLQHGYDWWIHPQDEDAATATTRLWSEFGITETPASPLTQPLTPLAHLMFADKASKINRRHDMEVIWHQAWIEPVQGEEKAIRHPIDVSLKDKLDIQLRGTLQLYVSRYLHINTDLTIQHYALAESKELAALSLPSSSTDKPDYRTDLLNDGKVSLSEPQLTPIRSARIRQSRRMRSNELHYVDHPMLGLVVKVIPIETEDDLLPPQDGKR